MPSTVLIIVSLWVLFIVVLVVAVLLHARHESHRTDFFYNIGGTERRRPRVVVTKVAYTPDGHAHRGATASSEPEATSENPVYVNHSSVVEVRALQHLREDGRDSESGYAA